jgi:hypothetical protein
MKTLITACALAFFASCAGSSDPRVLTDEGTKALDSGDYADAAKSFDAAVAALGPDTANPEWLRAKLGAIHARTQLDAGKAKDDFLALAAANPDKITADHFNRVASRLGTAKKLDEAIAVLDAGKKAFPGTKHLDALGKELVRSAKESGDAAALDSLKGLGYVGGDD